MLLIVVVSVQMHCDVKWALQSCDIFVIFGGKPKDDKVMSFTVFFLQSIFFLKSYFCLFRFFTYLLSFHFCTAGNEAFMIYGRNHITQRHLQAPIVSRGSKCF